jgi:drug/metabolite transporter (DMT)-like permease
MPPAKLAASAAVLGGALWIVNALLGDGDDPLSSTLFLVGMACLVVAAAIFGTSLVRSNARAMRITVGVASGLLMLCLVEAFRPADTPWYNGFWGILAVVVGGLGLLRSRGGAGGRPAQGAPAR